MVQFCYKNNLHWGTETRNSRWLGWKWIPHCNLKTLAKFFQVPSVSFREIAKCDYSLFLHGEIISYFPSRGALTERFHVK